MRSGSINIELPPIVSSPGFSEEGPSEIPSDIVSSSLLHHQKTSGR